MSEIPAELKRKSWSLLLSVLMALSALVVMAGPASADQGATDAYGYRWTSSDLPDPTVSFSWVEIGGTGTNAGVAGDDQYAGPFPVGFTFPFYENAYSEFYVNTNGYISFGAGSAYYGNEFIPSSNDPNDIVAPYWDDLYFESPTVYYETRGSSPNSQLVVEWYDVRELGDVYYMSFELILNETGEIWFQYDWMSGETGDSATVGIENSAGSTGCQYSYESSVLHDSLAIMFELAPVSIGPSQSATAAPDGEVYYSMTVTNRMGFTESFDITYSSYLGWEVTLYDASYALLGDVNSNGIPDTGDISDGSSVDIIVGVYLPPSPVDRFETTYVWATSFTDPGSSSVAVVSTTAMIAEFSLPHFDFGWDEESDGLFDYLVVDANVEAYFSGVYHIDAYLYDSSWNNIAFVSSDVYFDAGLSYAQIWFLGWQIYNNGVDGPYSVDLYLYDEYWSYLDYDLHVTDSYAWTSFELPPAALSPPHTDYGVDTNGDALYNDLVVQVSVDVTVAGDYLLYGDLYDSSWSYIAGDDQGVYLDVGPQTVGLTFPGWLISDHGVDGPYGVELSLYDASMNSLGYDYHSTQAYLFTDFQGPPVEFSPPHDDYGVDTFLDGLYDYLVVDVAVNVVTAGYYYVDAYLYDSWGGYILSAEVYTYLDLDLQFVQLSFDGRTIRNYGSDGPYEVYLDVIDEYWTLIDSDIYWTAPYGYDEFQSDALFSPPHSDYGVDTDLDGLFDYLAVDVAITVSTPGYYYIYGELYDWMMDYIDYVDYNTGWLDTGAYSVQLLFPGFVILANGVDGPYEVVLNLYNDWWYWSDSDTHLTDAYAATDFQGPPAVFSPPHDDYGLDTDSNGLYDWLVVEVSISVDTPGDYYVSSDLYDMYGAYLGSDGDWFTFDAGLQTVEMSYIGWYINENGVDGPYSVYLGLEDGSGNLADSGMYDTSSYLDGDFEPIPARLTSLYFDYGFDENSDLLYDYLVVEAVVDVAKAGYYEAAGDLYSPFYGYWITDASTFVYLDVGVQVVDLMFPGWAIRNSGTDGPYEVGIYLYTEDGTWLHSGSHTTDTYYWYMFQTPSEFSPPHSDYGLDLNSDGLYDYLVIDALVSVATAGDYYVESYMYDQWGGYITWAEAYTYLDVGTRVVSLSFDGIEIRSQGSDGPYQVYMDLYDGYGNWLASDFYWTDSYNYDEFQEAAVFSPPHSDYGIDVDMDSLYDFLAVDAVVTVSTPGYYYVEANLYDSMWNWIDSAYSYTDWLDAGSHVVQLLIDGFLISNCGSDGPYNVYLYLYDDWGNWLDSDTHVTDAYLADEFQGPPAAFSPPHDDYGLDTDDNGLYDWLVVAVSVDVGMPGDYYVSSSLHDMYGTWIDSASGWYSLDQGPQTIELSYHGWPIEDNGVDGPCSVYMEMYDVWWNWLGTDVHTTDAYYYDDFEPLPAWLSPPHSDYGLDEDSDMLFDYLVVEVSVDVVKAGYYEVDGSLYDQYYWDWIAGASSFVYLDVGPQTVDLLFLGWVIQSSGLDGPYYVDMYLYCEDGTYLGYSFHGTDIYYWDDFQGPPAEFSPPHSDYGLDLNSDGLYDYLVVDVVVSVTTAGEDYYVESYVYDQWGGYITWADAIVYLDVGTQVVSLWFDGMEVRNQGSDGPYQVYMDLYDGYGNSLDSDFYWTDSYYYDEFQVAAVFSPPHSDYGIDIDTNLLFDFLAVDAVVTVSTPGYYNIEAGLYDSMWNWIDSVYFYTDWLDAGTYTLQLLFPGFIILSSGLDGPYNVDLYLFDDWGYWLGVDTHVTDAYTADEFQGPPAVLSPPHDDYGLDTDDNGLYDWLVVEVSVDVDIPGDYYVVGDLYDMDWTWVAGDGDWYTFDAGLQTVELSFLGWDINENGVDGPYTVYLSLCDAWWTWLGTDVHTTDAYYYDDFEPLPARLSPPHSDYGLDEDSDMLFDYLVVEVSVDVAKAGYYEVDGSLYDQDYWDWIADTSSFVYLDVGPQTVELLFPGWVIGNSGFDGPYYVDMYLYCEDGTYLGYSFHETDMYYWDDFQGPPVEFSPPHDDYGLDTDGDDLYEYLVVVAYVDVTTPGTYLVGAQLYDGVTNMIATNLTYLDFGTQAVEMKFNGWQIFGHGADGPYDVYMAVLTPDFSSIDEDWYTTSAYLYDDFDPTVPSLSSGWTLTAPTIDGELSADEWADATVLDMTIGDPLNRLEGTLLVMNNATHLFIAYDVTGDLTEGYSDGASVSFDTGNDEMFNDMGDDLFLVGGGYGEETLHACYFDSYGDIETDCAPFDDTMTDHAGLAGARGFGPSDASALDHRMYELSIPLALIDAVPGDVLGFVAGSFFEYGIYDDATDEYSCWPVVDIWDMTLTDFADLVLAELPDTTASLSGSMGLNDWYVSDVTVTLMAAGGEGGVDYTMYRVDDGSWLTYDAPFDVTADGAHIVEFYSVDLAGNVEPMQSVSFGIDATGPVTNADMSGTGMGEWWSSDVAVELVADDGPGSGVDFTMYRVDGGTWTMYTTGFVVSGLGSHTLEFYSADLAGNEETVVSVEIDIEDLAPETTCDLAGTIGLDDWYTTSVTMTLTAADDVGGSGVAETFYRIGTGSWQTYTAPVVVTAQGIVNVSYYSVDNAGNVEATEWVVFEIDSVGPMTTPSVSGTEGENGWYTTSVSVTLSGSDATSGLADIMYRVDGGDWTVYASAFEVSGDGSHTVEYYAADEAGNEEVVNEVAVDIDATAPEATSSVTGVNVTLSATDDTSGVYSIMYRVDGGAWQTYAGVFAVTGAVGNHTVEFYAVDEAGNEGTVESVVVMVPAADTGDGGGLSIMVIGGIALVVIIVVVLLVYLLVFRKKKGGSRAPAPKDEDPPPPE